MSYSTMKHAIAMGVASAIALGAATPLWAAPVLSKTAIVQATSPSDVIDVQYRGRYHRGNGAGIVLGALGVVGAVAAASAYQNHYYADQGYYEPAPGYYGSAYGSAYEYGPSPGYNEYTYAPRYDRPRSNSW